MARGRVRLITHFVDEEHALRIEVGKAVAMVAEQRGHDLRRPRFSVPTRTYGGARANGEMTDSARALGPPRARTRRPALGPSRSRSA